MIKSKLLHKVIGLVAAGAVLASMTVASVTLGSAATVQVERYSLYDDVTTDTNAQWRDFGSVGAIGGTYNDLSAFTAFTPSWSDGVIKYTNFTSSTSAVLGFEGGDAKTFFTVQEGDTLNLNLRYDLPEGASWSWQVELYNKATSTYTNLSSAIADAAGVSKSADGNYLTAANTDIIVSLPLDEIMGVGTEVNFIRFYFAFAEQSDVTAFTINEFSITQETEVEALYEANTDSLDNWTTYQEGYEPNAYLAPIGDGTAEDYTAHMKGEVVTDGIRFTFTDAFYTSNQATNAYGSFVRQFNGDAWCTVNNDSYLNMHFKLEADSSIYGVQLLVRVGTTGDEDTTPALANLFGVETNALTGIGADGTTETSYDALPAGEYTFSISFADLLADYPDQLAMLEEGAPFVFHQLFVRADDSCAATDEVALTVYDVSVTTAPVYSSNVYDDLVEDPTTSSGTSSSSSSTSSASSSTASRTQSTSSQVDTGDAVMPIIGVAALAVVATSAVIVSKKRK